MKKLDLTKIDLEPLAGYVAGHHPYSLRISQENLWREFWDVPETWSAESWEPIWTEIAQLNDALRVLAWGNHVLPTFLIELHRATDLFESICQKMADAPEAFDRTARVVPGYEDWRDMVRFSSRLTEGHEAADQWRELGAAVGNCRYSLAVNDQDYVPDDVATLLRLAGKLVRPEFQSIKTVIFKALPGLKRSAKTATLGAWLKQITTRYTLVSALNTRLQAILQRQAPPEPLLILEPATITFYGESKPINAFSEGEVACLWVLAEKPRVLMQRSQIISEGKVETEYNNLQFFINRVRKRILKPLVKEYCQQQKHSLPRAYKYGFIKGRKGIGSGTGPYMLDLDPAEVRIIGPRPLWMTPKRV